MHSLLLSCLGLLLLSLAHLTFATTDYPGVIELVGYSNRRARTHYIPLSSGRQLESVTLAPPPAKIRADIETVRQNIEKYNKLLTLDGRNLPESQKDMLQRIVERVARLKETLEDKVENANSSTTSADTTETAQSTTESATIGLDTETDPTLVLDETTLLQLQTSMDELAAAQAVVTAQTTGMRDMPTTTELNLETLAGGAPESTVPSGESTGATAATDADFVSTTPDAFTDATDFDDQFVAARSNNNAGITAADPDDGVATLTTMAGSQRTLTTSAKMTKTRATKRPGSSTKSGGISSGKRGQRPGVIASLYNSNNNKQTTLHTKPKLPSTASLTTIQPLQYQNKQQIQKTQPLLGYQQQQQHKVVSSASATNPITSATPSAEKRTTQAGLQLPTSAINTYGSGSSSSSISSSSLNTNNYNSNNNNNNNDLVYDTPVNTSSIIDSLNPAREDLYHQHKLAINHKDKKPSATAKPTKYHYYPHNQHIYLLPECAIQQVCNAVYVRLNYTQPLCACPSRYRDPCSASLNEDDQHTTKLVGDGKKKAITLAKTCEATTEMRECRSPKDWSLLALQNTRTGKSHYLVICRCPDHFKMEGPMAHDQPTYASVPGIRVFGMMCVKPGYSVRKPSVQPPKRYQLQKPFYRPSSQTSFVNNNQYGGVGGSNGASTINIGNNKDNYGRPIYGNGASSSSSSNSNGYHPQDLYQSQHQANYQYLNRPESSHSNYRPETLTSINNFPGSGGIYGRNNERKGDAPIEAANDDDKVLVSISTSTQPTDQTRTTLSVENTDAVSEGGDSATNVTENTATTVAAAAAATTNETAAPTTTTVDENKRERERRSIYAQDIDEVDDSDDMPEFPWDRVIELQQSIIWD